MGRIFPHVLAYPDQNAEKSCKEEEGGGEGEFARIEHAAKQQLKMASERFAAAKKASKPGSILHS